MKYKFKKKSALALAVLLNLACLPYAGATSGYYMAPNIEEAPDSGYEEIICSYPAATPYKPVSSVKINNPDGTTTQTDIYEYGEKQEITWSEDGRTKTVKHYSSEDDSSPYTNISETRDDGSRKETSIETDGTKRISITQKDGTMYGSTEYSNGAFETWTEPRFGNRETIKEYPDGSKLKLKTIDHYDNDYEIINGGKNSMAQKEYARHTGWGRQAVKFKNAPENTVVSFSDSSFSASFNSGGPRFRATGLGGQRNPGKAIFTLSDGNVLWKLDKPYKDSNGNVYKYATNERGVSDNEAYNMLLSVSEGTFREGNNLYAMVNYYDDDGRIHKYGLQVNPDGAVTNLGELDQKTIDYARNKIKSEGHDNEDSTEGFTYTAILNSSDEETRGLGIWRAPDDPWGYDSWGEDTPYTEEDKGLRVVTGMRTPHDDGSVFIEKTLANGWKIISVASPKNDDGEDAGADVRTMVQAPDGRNYFAPNSLADSMQEKDFSPSISFLKQVVVDAVAKTAEKLITNPDGTRTYSLIYSDNSTLNYEEVRNADGSITKVRQVYTDANGNAYDLGYVDAWYNYPSYNAYDMYSNPLWQAMNSSFLPAEVSEQAKSIKLANLAREEAGKESFPYIPAAAGTVVAAALAYAALNGQIKKGLAAVRKGFGTKLLKR